MSTLSIPNSFSPGTPAKSSEVNANFAAVKTFVDGLSAGTNIDAGAISSLKLDSDVLNVFTPIGGVLQYAGSSAPAGGKWMLCDGAEVSRTSYSALFSAIGVSYGAGNGSTTFNIPNLKGRIPVGYDATQTEFDALGESGGSKTSVAAHTHSVSGTAAGAYTGVGMNGAGGHDHSWSTTDTGDHAHFVATDLLTSTTSHGHGQNGQIMGGSSATPSSTGTYTIGVDGQHSHSGTTSGVGNHAHDIVDPTHAHSVSGTATETGSTSGNLQPYVVMNYLIRVA